MEDILRLLVIERFDRNNNRCENIHNANHCNTKNIILAFISFICILGCNAISGVRISGEIKPLKYSIVC